LESARDSDASTTDSGSAVPEDFTFDGPLHETTTALCARRWPSSLRTPPSTSITPKENTTLPAKDGLQSFVAFLDVVGVPGAIKLDRRNILFLVPPK
jgi:hypothetical protein